MNRIIERIARAFLAPPAQRLAADKRRLEQICITHGTSRSVALRITSAYFSGDK